MGAGRRTLHRPARQPGPRVVHSVPASHVTRLPAGVVVGAGHSGPHIGVFAEIAERFDAPTAETRNRTRTKMRVTAVQSSGRAHGAPPMSPSDASGWPGTGSSTRSTHSGGFSQRLRSSTSRCASGASGVIAW